MMPRVFRAYGWLATCLLIGAAGSAAATSADPPARSAANASRTITTAATGAIPTRPTTILGAAWHADDSPIPYARLRLRHVLTGRIAATAVADETGRFSYTGVESGTYVIELVSERGKLLALGHRFTIAPGETVVTFVRLGTRVPWFDGFFSNAAAAASSIAALAGVTAIAPGAVRPVSAQK